MDKKLIPSLNGIRAISILIVIFSHFKILNNFIRNNFYPALILENGALGVNIFFVISGFLITKLLIAEEEKKGQVSLKNFYIRRILRIFPAYYFLLIIYYLLQNFKLIQLSNSSWISALTYSKFLNHSLDVYSEHLWSLSVEEWFYLFWPFIFIYLPRRRLLIALIVIILVPLIRLYGYNHKIYLFEIDGLTLFQRADGLMIGCIIALFYEKSLQLSIKIFKFIKFPKLLLLIFFCFAVFLENLNIKHHLHLGIFLIPLLGSGGTITLLFIGLLILFSINDKTSWWYFFLNSKIMNYLGKLSYSLYLWQQIIIYGSLGFVSNKPYNLFFTFLLANISHYFIERPFLKLKNKF